MPEETQEGAGSPETVSVISAAENFISEVKGMLGQTTRMSLFASEERRIMQNHIDTLNGQIQQLQLDLDECEGRDCEEYDPDSVENMTDPPPRGSGGRNR